MVISYARRDGQALAFEIRRELETRGIRCRMDHTDMKGGADWRRQFEQWIRKSRHLVLVLTPAALAPPKCAWEWQLARSIGRGVCPVWPTPSDIESAGLRRWMKYAHQFSYSIPEQRLNLFEMLVREAETARTPDMSDFADVSRHTVRSRLSREVMSRLLDEDKEARATVLGLCGGAGYGKTEIAALIAQEPAVCEAHFDGILYAKLGCIVSREHE